MVINVISWNYDVICEKCDSEYEIVLYGGYIPKNWDVNNRIICPVCGNAYTITDDFIKENYPKTVKTYGVSSDKYIETKSNIKILL